MLVHSVSARAGRLVRERSGVVIALTLLATAGFVSALVLIPSYPSSDAFDADTDVVRAMTRIEDALPPRGFVIPFLVEATPAAGGNVLTREAFDEMLAREDAVRADPVIAPLVYAYQDPNLRMEVSSVWSLPDTLRAVMDGETPLAYAVGWYVPGQPAPPGYDEATDDEWRDALDKLLSFEAEDGSFPFQRALSQDAAKVDGAWRARSIMGGPSVDNALLFERYVKDPSKATPERPYFEDFQLHVADVAARDTTLTDWRGIALGINTEIERQVMESSKLVGAAFLVIGVVLYLTLRNWRDFAVAFLSLPLLIVWMTGGARLAGLSDNQFTAMLPVLILALGVDYAIHGVRRYREERAAHAPAAAVERSVGFLGPALLLAAATTSAAFFSNSFTNIVGLRHWAIEGGLAIIAALWICGVFAPALRYAWDRRRLRRGRLPDAPRASSTAARVHEGTLLGRLAVRASRRPALVLGAVALVVGPATVLALGIETDFDAKDFFDSRSDLIRNLDRLAEDFPDEGEPALLLVEGDVADPRVVAALAEAIDGMKARNYAPERDFSLPALVQTFMRHQDVNGGTDYADANGDDVPDRAEDVRDLLARALRDGVSVTVPAPPPPALDPGPPVGPVYAPNAQPGEAVLLAYSKETVRELVHPDGAGGFDMTVLYVGIPGTDDFTRIPAAADAVRAAAADLHALEGDAVTRITLTGEPFKRYEQVNAITDSLKVSAPLSVVLCFVIVFLAFRNVGYSLVTLAPVVLLVPVLYGFMVVVGLSLNLVTATIAAMAIGVGVDYSLHLTERYREERERHGRSTEDALRRSMDSSGLALLGSVTTTILGFLALLFAPMPLFRNFGLLTAAMAASSFLTAVVVLPPLLAVRERVIERRGRRSVSVAEPRAAEAAGAAEAAAPHSR